MSAQRPELSQEARMAMWRDLWRYLLKLPDGDVPMRDTVADLAQPRAEQDAEAES